MPERGNQNRIGAEPVHELHGLRVFEEIAPSGFNDPQIAGNDGAVHQRPGIVAEGPASNPATRPPR